MAVALPALQCSGSVSGWLVALFQRRHQFLKTRLIESDDGVKHVLFANVSSSPSKDKPY